MKDGKKTLMITGASGFIGTSFIERYRDQYDVIPVDLLTTTPEELDYHNVDTVLHLAALVHQRKKISREKYFEVNTELTRRMGEAAKSGGVRHFVFFSTVKVYGSDGDFNNHNIIYDETSPCNPVNDPYGESKWEAEKLLRNMESDDFIISIIRPPMVYGKGVKGNMPKLITFVKYLPVLPFNYTKNKRSFVNIKNLLHLTSLVINRTKSGIFLPLDEKNLSLKELVQGISEALHVKKIFVPMIQPVFWMLVKLFKDEMERLYGSLQFQNEKTRLSLKYYPIVDYKTGIKEMV